MNKHLAIRKKRVIELPDGTRKITLSFRATKRRGGIKGARKTNIPKGSETVVIKMQKRKPITKPIHVPRLSAEPKSKTPVKKSGGAKNTGTKSKPKPAKKKSNASPSASTSPKKESKPKTGPAKKPVDFKKVQNYLYRYFVVNGKEVAMRPGFTVICYRDGYLYATNGFVIAKMRFAYRKELEGKALNKSGKDWFSSIPDYNSIYKQATGKEKAVLKGLIIRQGNKPADKVAKVADGFYVDMQQLAPVLSLFEMIGETPVATVTRRKVSEIDAGFLLLLSGSLAVVIMQYPIVNF